VIFAIRVLGGDRTVICSQLIFIWLFKKKKKKKTNLP
jgi:hypothetical protein